VFGGLNLEMVFGELFVLDTMPTPPQWSQIPAAAGALWPPARALSRMESWQGALWLFGGTSTSDASAVLGDFFHFNLSTLTWSLVDGTTGPPPSPRAGHGSAVLGTVMYIFGGINLNLGYLNDLHAFDLVARAWTQIGPTSGIVCEGGKPVTARYGMGFIGIKSRLLLFGGTGFDGTFDDLLVIEPASITCTQLNTSGAAPASRLSPAMAAFGSRAYIFGGKGGSASGLLGDLWAIGSPSNVPWPRGGHVGLFIGVYDWDTIFVEAADGFDSLVIHVELCTRFFPCTLRVTGVGKGVMMRELDGSIKCSAGRGCTGVQLKGVQVICTYVLFAV